MPTKGLSIAERFWPRVDRSGGPDACWPWIGKSRHKFGYGTIWVGPGLGVEGAHRVAYRLVRGEILDGHALAHSCDNPPCCNPAHLEAMPNGGNVQQMWGKGRGTSKRPTGERNGAARLTMEAATEIRAARAAGDQVNAIAARHGVNRTTVRAVLQGKRWAAHQATARSS
jgi:hypothetical protein